MKRIIGLCLGVSLLASLAAAQSLGEAARRQRQQKKPAAARVYTNDDLPTSAPINIGSPAATITDAKSGEKQKVDDKASTPEDKAQRNAEWKGKFDDQRKSISLLERELDVLQREYKQQIALYYSDAGNQLRDSRNWAEQQRKYEAEIAAKQKDLADARQKLDNLKEQARKAGIPSSVSD